MRVEFNEGQEIIRQDLNKLQAAKEREFYDRAIYELLSRESNAFFEKSLKVSFVDSNTVEVAAGFGFQTDNTQVSPEPIRRPIYLVANTEFDITAPDPSDDRIDIVVVKAERAVTGTENRRYKSTVQSVPTTQSFDVEMDWEAEIEIVAGTPAGSPSAPSTPAGYIKIAELYITANTGMADQGDITDFRSILPSIARAQSAYDAYVGTSEISTHEFLSEALNDAQSGWKILIQESESISSSLTIDSDNITLVGAPGVTLTDDGANTGLIIDADGVRIEGLRFIDFTTAIQIEDGSQNNFIVNNSFNNCTTDIDDQNTTPNNVHMHNIQE